jgi:hypothetical protein
VDRITDSDKLAITPQIPCRESPKVLRTGSLDAFVAGKGKGNKLFHFMNSRNIFSVSVSRGRMCRTIHSTMDLYASRQAPRFHIDLKSKVMKKNITSNLRLLTHTLCAFIIAAALWVMPRSARAQLYVGNAPGSFGAGVVSKYSAKTGHMINANFITGLSSPPRALAVEDNTLFVSDGDSIGTYDATTGAVIKKDFFTALRIIIGFVLILPSGNTGYSLAQNGVIWEVVDGIGLADIITGLDHPSGLAVFGSEEKAVLFVTDRNEDGGGTVAEYDGNTGVTINRHFITGLMGPTGLAVTGNTLFVANTTGGTVGKYDATTGGAVNAGFITGLEEPNALAVKENTLFVTSADGHKVGAYDATTGAVIDAHFITGLTHAAGIAVKSAK